MTDYIKIPGLVAENISQELAEKLQTPSVDLKDYVKISHAVSGITFYVSENGNDSTADGTAEKPFRNLKTALKYANTSKTDETSDFTVKFLSDYTETDSINIFNNLSKIVIDGEGHNVVLRNAILSSAWVTFKNLTFNNHADNPYNKIIYASGKSYLFFRGNNVINADNSDALNTIIECAEKSILNVQGSLTINNPSDKQLTSAIRLRKDGLFLGEVDSFSVTGSYRDVFELYDKAAAFLIGDYSSESAEPVSYNLTTGSYIRLYGKGNNPVSNAQPGTADETCTIVP